MLAPPTPLAFDPCALVGADARAHTLLACALSALVGAETRAPAFLALAPLALMRALRGLLRGRPAALLNLFRRSLLSFCDYFAAICCFLRTLLLLFDAALV